MKKTFDFSVRHWQAYAESQMELSLAIVECMLKLERRYKDRLLPLTDSFNFGKPFWYNQNTFTVKVYEPGTSEDS